MYQYLERVEVGVALGQGEVAVEVDRLAEDGVLGGPHTHQGGRGPGGGLGPLGTWGQRRVKIKICRQKSCCILISLELTRQAEK